jgi:hypothetical protein
MIRRPPLHVRVVRALFTFGLVLSAGSAGAQNPPPPQFKFEKPPEAAADWKVQAKGGLLQTTGNSRSTNGSFALMGSRQAGDNKLSLEAGLAYGRSKILVPTLDANGDVIGFGRRGETTTNEWKARGRYDRFLTANNAAYVLGQIGADRIAGKELWGGGQAGYSRQLVKNEQHTTVAELGYDFSYESYVEQPGKSIDPVAIHSARVFVGELWTLTPDTGITASVEALFNLNEESALDASDSTGATTKVGSFEDTRVVGKLGVTTKLYENLSFGFSFTAKYDQNPAPRPLPASAAGAGYAPGFQAFADEVDTLTEATLIFTFL